MDDMMDGKAAEDEWTNVVIAVSSAHNKCHIMTHDDCCFDWTMKLIAR